MQAEVVIRAPFLLVSRVIAPATPSRVHPRARLTHLLRPPYGTTPSDAKTMDLFISAGQELQILRVRDIPLGR